MEGKDIFELLQGTFGDEVILEFLGEGVDPHVIYVGGGRVAEVLTLLRDDERTAFDSLMSLSGLDYEDRMEVVYHLHSLSLRHKIAIKVKLDRESPRVPTAEGVYPVANFHEREAYDLFGIIFTGHSDLRRILLPEDWPGHPLRKDYEYPESYHGVKV